MILEGVGWDKKEFPEFNLHVYGKDDNRIIGYNMERWLKNQKMTRERKPLRTIH